MNVANIMKKTSLFVNTWAQLLAFLVKNVIIREYMSSVVSLFSSDFSTATLRTYLIKPTVDNFDSKVWLPNKAWPPLCPWVYTADKSARCLGL